jgi:hypothetical protein
MGGGSNMINCIDWEDKKLLNSKLIYLGNRDKYLLFEFVGGSIGCNAFGDLILHLSREKQTKRVDLLALIQHVGMFETEGLILFLRLCVTTAFSDDIISEELFSTIKNQYN